MKPALASMRTVDALNYMTINPRTPLTLKELSVALGVNAGSMSAILLALADAGFVVRHPTHKTYTLGPALVATGHAAAEMNPVVERARRVMPELAALGTECIGSTLVGDEIVVIAIEGTPSPHSQPVRIGQHLPYVAPFGAVFRVWGSLSASRGWLQLGDDVTLFEKSLRIARGRGYAVGLVTETSATMRDLTLRAGMQPHDEQLQKQLRASVPAQGHRYLLDEIEDSSTYPVSVIAAPVFGPDRRVSYALTVQGTGPIAGREVGRIGGILSDTCRTLTRELGGQAPDLD